MLIERDVVVFTFVRKCAPCMYVQSHVFARGSETKLIWIICVNCDHFFWPLTSLKLLCTSPVLLSGWFCLLTLCLSWTDGHKCVTLTCFNAEAFFELKLNWTKSSKKN